MIKRGRYSKMTEVIPPQNRFIGSAGPCALHPAIAKDKPSRYSTCVASGRCIFIFTLGGADGKSE